MKKICTICKVSKTLSDFHKRSSSSDGYRSNCKDCRKKQYKLNPEADKKRSRKSYYLNYDHSRRVNREWGLKNKSKMNGYKLEWRRKNKEKRLAHYAVGNALRDGKLIKQECEVCGLMDSHAHHPDYSKKLIVVWLCPRHHSDLHKKMKYNLTKI